MKNLYNLIILAAVTLAGWFVFSSANWNDTSVPLSNLDQRQRLLTFGFYVTPDHEQNPISPPERFTGYHSGLDFEILPGEETKIVEVRAICDGKIINTNTVDGYGGVVLQACVFDGVPATVLYGHIRNFTFKKGQHVQRGKVIAELSSARTSQSGGTRKHLHLGIRKGDRIDYRGYVQSQRELDDFIDPAQVLGLE